MICSPGRVTHWLPLQLRSFLFRFTLSSERADVFPACRALMPTSMGRSTEPFLEKSKEAPSAQNSHPLHLSVVQWPKEANSELLSLIMSIHKLFLQRHYFLVKFTVIQAHCYPQALNTAVQFTVLYITKT